MAAQAVQTLLFPSLFGKPLVATFDTPHQSSDGGAILLKAIDDELGLTARLAACIPEWRQEGKIEHDLPTLIRQRCYGLACGYADANDAAALKADPIHKLLVGRDPVAGAALASQPTLSRFENSVGPRALYRLTQTLADVVLAAHQARLARQRVTRITIDLDPTDDPTHGQQELTFFNGHYGTWCYLPIVGTLTFNGERTQHLVTAILRPGNAHATRGVLGILRRLFFKLRLAFPHARLRVRLDGGFASPAVFTFLEAEGVEYLVAMASNPKLEKRVRRLLGKARMRSKATGETATLFAGAGAGQGVSKTTDGGGSWSAANTGLTCGSYSCKTLALAIDPQTPTTVYAGTEGYGVYKTTDGGGSWSPVNTGLTNTDIRALALAPQTPSTLYAGTAGGVSTSTDGGASWSAVNRGSPISMSTHSPRTPRRRRGSMPGRRRASSSSTPPQAVEAAGTVAEEGVATAAASSPRRRSGRPWPRRSKPCARSAIPISSRTRRGVCWCRGTMP